MTVISAADIDWDDWNFKGVPLQALGLTNGPMEHYWFKDRTSLGGDTGDLLKDMIAEIERPTLQLMENGAASPSDQHIKEIAQQVIQGTPGTLRAADQSTIIGEDSTSELLDAVFPEGALGNITPARTGRGVAFSDVATTTAALTALTRNLMLRIEGLEGILKELSSQHDFLLSQVKDLRSMEAAEAFERVSSEL